MPGSFELPVVAKAMAKSGRFDAVVCIGVVVSVCLSVSQLDEAAFIMGCISCVCLSLDVAPCRLYSPCKNHCPIGRKHLPQCLRLAAETTANEPQLSVRVCMVDKDLSVCVATCAVFPWHAAQVRGATTHYDAVVGAATSGVLNASTDTGACKAAELSVSATACDSTRGSSSRGGGPGVHTQRLGQGS